MSSTDSSKKGSGSSGRRVDNMGPILMSPGGTFKVPPQNIFNPANAATATPPSRSPSKVSRSVDLEGGVAALERLLEIPDPNELVLRELFGGALSMQIPRSFEDVSIIREVLLVAYHIDLYLAPILQFLAFNFILHYVLSFLVFFAFIIHCFLVSCFFIFLSSVVPSAQ